MNTCVVTLCWSPSMMSVQTDRELKGGRLFMGQLFLFNPKTAKFTLQRRLMCKALSAYTRKKNTTTKCMNTSARKKMVRL